MAETFQSLALVLAGAVLGWTGYFTFLAAPQAFRDLDNGRANRLVRNAMKSGHPAAAGLALAGAGAAALAGAVAGAAVLAMAAVLYLIARWALAPRDDERPAGATRRLKTARIVAAALTAVILVMVAIGAGLVGVGV